MRTLIVGDVHGCLDELNDLLATAKWTPADTLVLAGDLVAKGPDSNGVLHRARELGALAVLGNHDEKVLEWRRGHTEKLKPHHRAVAESLDEAGWKYLEALPLYLDLEHALVVHAGLVPGRPLAQQRKDDLIAMRSLTPSGEATSQIEGFAPWASRWPGPKLVVFGHDAVRGLQQYPHALGLDSGCVYGRTLTAVWLPERRLVQVSARRAYVDLPAKPRG